MATAVNERSDAATALANEYPMLEALVSGTRAMRDKGEELLPRFPGEAGESYEKRRQTATLFPAYRRTVSVMAGKPFSKQATLSDDAPAQITEWAKDIDREGVSLHVFAAEMFAESFYGLAGILVEAPKPPEPTGKVVTLADEKAAGIRPYFVRVMHNQFIGWRVESINGARQLTQLRIAEATVTKDGDFGERIVQRVRVLDPGSWRLFEKASVGDDAKWIEIDSGVTGLAYIPFVPLYGVRRSFMDGACPLLDLAYLNVKHWQSQSDQDNITRFARVPNIVVIGVEDPAFEIRLGAGSATRLPMGADMKIVEHSGASIGAGAKSLEDLEDQMIQAGAELLVKTPGQRTATESNNDAEANKCDLQRMVEDFESGLDSALQMLADYAKLPDAGNVSLFKDFGAATLSDASAQLILSLQQGGVISTKTAIQELQRRGTLSPDIDPDEEAEEVTEQGPALGTITEPTAPGAPDQTSGDDKLGQAA